MVSNVRSPPTVTSIPVHCPVLVSRWHSRILLPMSITIHSIGGIRSLKFSDIRSFPSFRISGFYIRFHEKWGIARAGFGSHFLSLNSSDNCLSEILFVKNFSRIFGCPDPAKFRPLEIRIGCFVISHFQVLKVFFLTVLSLAALVRFEVPMTT